MPYLVVENGLQRGLKVEVRTGAALTFGRDPGATITTADHLCSRQHFSIEVQNGAFVLRDLGSSNGTFLNDERIAEGRLAHGDCLQAGETRFTFLEDAGGGARGLVGKDVGGYRILDRIGRGGMGTVYKANQVSLNRVVALKILSPKVAQDPAFVKRFHAEARAAGRLNHPNIVQVYDVGSDRDLHYYSMEYIENGSVQDMATRDGVLDPSLSLAIVVDAARGLEYAEKRNLVHRDIKPDNLMINAEGVVKIADLGLARDAGENARERGEHQGEHHPDDEGIFGTPHFISPEQARGQKVDTRSDIYSLGATFYRLVTGTTPFKGENVREIIQKQVSEVPAPAREVERKVPAVVSSIIERMMRKDPGERYQTASALLEDLLRAQVQVEGGSRRRMLVLAAAAVLLLGVAGALLLKSRSDGGDPRPAPPVVVAPPKDTAAEEAERRQLEIERLKVEAARAATDARSYDLDQVNRSIPVLDDVLARYEKVAETYAATEIAEWIRGELKEHLDRVRAERQTLVAKEEQAEAQARARRADAETALAAARKAAEDAAAAGRFGAAVAAWMQIEDGKALEGTDLAAQVAPGVAKVLAGAQALEARLVEETAARAAAGAFDEAARALDAAGTAAVADVPEATLADARLAPVLALRDRLRAAATSVREAKARKEAEDLAHDERVGFATRRAVLDVLGRSFAPDDAAGLLADVLPDIRTAEWRRSLEMLAEDVAAARRTRDRYVALLVPKVAGGVTIGLPSAADSNRILMWNVDAVDKKGFTARRGPIVKEFAFTEFTPSDAYEHLLKKDLPEKDAEVLQDLVRLFLVAGDPLRAGTLMNDLPPGDSCREALRKRVRREIEGADLVARVRKLEGQAQGEPKHYLELLPRLEELRSGYRDTYVYARNSNGSTPLFAPNPE